MILTKFEKKFIAAVWQGEQFDCENHEGTEIIIRAKLIRQLYLNINQSDQTSHSITNIHATEYGVRINGATIDGRLNLDELGRHSQHGAPSLHLTNCKFSNGISACNAIINEINLSNCEFQNYSGAELDKPPIHLTRSKILGSLNLSDVRGKSDDTPIWVLANSLSVESGVILDNASFFYQPRESLNNSASRYYALDFDNSRIKGGFTSKLDLYCHGGINLAYSKIEGTIWLLGSHIVGGEGAAVRAQGVSLTGNLIYRPQETEGNSSYEAICEGEIDLLGAIVTGVVHFPGLQVRKHRYIDKPGSNKISITLAKAEIGSDFSTHIWIGDEGAVQPFSCFHAIDIRFAKINSNVNFNGADIGADKEAAGQNQISILADDCKIGNNLEFSTQTYEGTTYQATVQGSIIFDRSMIHGEISLSQLKIKNESGAKLYLQKACIEGEVKLLECSLSDGFVCTGSTIKGRCVIILDRPSRNGFSKPKFVELDLSLSKFGLALWVYADVSSFNLSESNIETQAVLNLTATESINLEQSNIGGNLLFDNFQFQSSIQKSDQSNVHSIKMEGCNIAGNLKINLAPKEDVSDLLITNAWKRNLNCYPNWTLYEVEVSRSNGIWYTTFLKLPKDSPEYKNLYLCNSRSSIFHQLNSTGLLDLSAEALAFEYVKLFCACTWGKDGPFVITETTNDLPLAYANRSPENFEPVNIDTIKSIPQESQINDKNEDEPRRPPEGEQYLLKTYIRYGHELFVSYLSIHQEGYIDMLDDTKLLTFPETLAPEYKAPLRKRSDFLLANQT